MLDRSAFRRTTWKSMISPVRATPSPLRRTTGALTGSSKKYPATRIDWHWESDAVQASQRSIAAADALSTIVTTMIQHQVAWPIGLDLEVTGARHADADRLSSVSIQRWCASGRCPAESGTVACATVTS